MKKVVGSLKEGKVERRKRKNGAGGNGEGGKRGG